MRRTHRPKPVRNFGIAGPSGKVLVVVEFANQEDANRFGEYVAENDQTIVEFDKFADPLIESVPARVYE